MADCKIRNALVTGGAGFIGSHVVDRFPTNVAVVDDLRMKVNFLPTVGGLSHRKFDVFDTHLYMGELERADCIVHCAARADVQYNWTNIKERRRMWEENIDATVSLLEDAPPVPFVLLSTCAVYGDTPLAWNKGLSGIGYQEDTAACIATSPYAASKLATEAIVQTYQIHRQAPWYVFRLGCVVGSHYHHGHIAEFVERFNAQGRLEARSSGPQKSFVHVGDVADACFHAVTEGWPSGVYNLHGGLWSARETVDVMGLPAGKVSWPTDDHGWDGDTIPIVSSAKVEKASGGWKPSRSVAIGVSEALQTLKWKRS